MKISKEEWIDAFISRERQKNHIGIDWTSEEKILRYSMSHSKYVARTKDNNNKVQYLTFDSSSLEDIMTFFFDKRKDIQELLVWNIYGCELDICIPESAFKVNAVYRKFFEMISLIMDGNEHLLDKCYTLDDMIIETCMANYTDSHRAKSIRDYEKENTKRRVEKQRRKDGTTVDV